MNRRAVILLVRSAARALKAVGYYDAGHPILRQLHREVYRSFKEAIDGQPSVALACAGAKLLIGEAEKPLTDEPAKSLATHLFSRSIVAIKLGAKLPLKDLGTLMQSLAESPERLRDAGGLKPLLERQQTQGIEIVEVDFEQLFAGKKTDIAGTEPLVEKALGELLRFKQNKERTGTALGISLDQISSPESLGTLLDELLENAIPGVATPSLGSDMGGRLSGGGAPGGRGQLAGGGGGAGRGGNGAAGPGAAGGTPLRGVRGGGTVGAAALSGISADELAELATQAFLGTWQKLQAQGAPEIKLAQTAQVLAKALVRLSPEARFSLLRQLAGAEGQAATGGAVTNLATEIKDDLILDAITSVLAAQTGDPETIEAVGTLLRQLRPIESERRKILDSLDQTLRSQGQPLDGMLWQELQASAFATQGLGMLELTFRQSSGPLAERAQARIKQGGNPPEIQQILATLDPRHRAARAAKLLCELLPNNRELPSGMASMAKDIIDGVDAGDGAPTGEHLKLLMQLVKRAEGQPSSSAVGQTIKDLLSGPKGAQRSIALVRSQACPGSAVLADALLNALDAPLTLDVRRELVATFSTLDEAMAKSLRAKAGDAKPNGVYQIVLLAIRSSPGAALDVARQGLRNRSPKAKEAALRALSALPQQNAVGLLSKAAGSEGDEESLKIFSLEQPTAPEAEDRLRSLQRVAIEALGQMRSELAVPVLDNLLQRRKLVGGAAFDALRAYAAQALAANGTAAARLALQAGKASRHKATRDACARL